MCGEQNLCVCISCVIDISGTGELYVQVKVVCLAGVALYTVMSWTWHVNGRPAFSFRCLPTFLMNQAAICCCVERRFFSHWPCPGVPMSSMTTIKELFKMHMRKYILKNAHKTCDICYCQITHPSMSGKQKLTSQEKTKVSFMMTTLSFYAKTQNSHAHGILQSTVDKIL